MASITDIPNYLMGGSGIYVMYKYQQGTKNLGLNRLEAASYALDSLFSFLTAKPGVIAGGDTNAPPVSIPPVITPPVVTPPVVIPPVTPIPPPVVTPLYDHLQQFTLNVPIYFFEHHLVLVNMNYGSVVGGPYDYITLYDEEEGMHHLLRRYIDGSNRTRWYGGGNLWYKLRALIGSNVARVDLHYGNKPE